MKLLATIMTAFVAVSHYGFMALEMFFWNHPMGQKIFDMTPEFAEASAPLAANQGLYNGFLATGLVWGLLSKQTNVKIFFSPVLLWRAYLVASLQNHPFFIRKLYPLLSP